MRFLARALGLSSAEQVIERLRRYYPNEKIKPATRFFIEEIMSP